MCTLENSHMHENPKDSEATEATLSIKDILDKGENAAGGGGEGMGY